MFLAFHDLGCKMSIKMHFLFSRLDKFTENLELSVIIMESGSTRASWCCNLSGGVALIVWFTTNGMCAKNENIYTWREQAMIREIATHNLYCCLLPWCEALRTCRSRFPIATKWCCDQDAEVVPSSAFTSVVLKPWPAKKFSLERNLTF